MQHFDPEGDLLQAVQETGDTLHKTDQFGSSLKPYGTNW